MYGYKNSLHNKKLDFRSMSNISDITVIYWAADVHYICHRKSHGNFANGKEFRSVIHYAKDKFPWGIIFSFFKSVFSYFLIKIVMRLTSNKNRNSEI